MCEDGKLQLIGCTQRNSEANGECYYSFTQWFIRYIRLKDLGLTISIS